MALEDINEMTRKSRRKDFDLLTQPADRSGNVRDILGKHLSVVVTAHNAKIQAVIEYISSGVTQPLIEDRIPFIAYLLNKSPREKEAAISNIKQTMVTQPDFSGMTDSEFVEAALKTTLDLRSVLLPDTCA